MQQCTARIAALYARYENSVSHLQSLLLLSVRLYWGWQFLQTGWGKLTGIPKVVEFFTSLGIPFPTLNAYLVGTVEFLGGVLLLFGLASRIIALPLTFNMLVAYMTADRDAFLSIFSDPGKFYAADPFTFLFASVLVLVFGPGIFSLDHLIAALHRRKANTVEGVPAIDAVALSSTNRG